MANVTLAKAIDQKYFETIEYFRIANEMSRHDFIRSLRDMAEGHMGHRVDIIEMIYEDPDHSVELLEQ